MKYYLSPFGVICSEDRLQYEEISKEEYDSKIVVINKKRDYTNKLYNGEITENDIPIEYRADVIAEVEAIVKAEKSPPDDSIGFDEALSIIMGVEE